MISRPLTSPLSAIIKKSPTFKIGISPLFIKWAFFTIIDCSDCLNISSRFTDSTTPDFKMSASTFPAPTDGSWSLSPTKMSLVGLSMDFRSVSMRRISTIETSSKIKTSHSSSSIFEKPRSPAKPISRSLWIVKASRPVCSFILLAALPVGAASFITLSMDSKMSIKTFSVVVFPVPGPPVMTKTPLFIASLTALLCVFESSISLNFSVSIIFLSMSKFLSSSKLMFKSFNLPAT